MKETKEKLALFLPRYFYRENKVYYGYFTIKIQINFYLRYYLLKIDYNVYFIEISNCHYQGL